MPTMAESPAADSRITELNPDEVSGVDMPAIGEPHFVVKGMAVASNKEAPMAKPKKVKKVRTAMLDTTQVPRPVMQAVHKRLLRVQDNLNELQTVVKGLKVEDGMVSKEAPSFLVDMTKAVAAELRSLQPSDTVPATKRAQAASVTSLRDITKQVEDREKGNAVSYLTRDEYVSVTSSVSEYLSTYVDGIETDVDGPMLIPTGLDEVIDKTAGPLEEVVAQYEGESTETPVETPSDESTQNVPTSKGIESRLDSLASRIEEVAAGMTKKEMNMETEDTTEVATEEPAATEDAPEEETPETTSEEAAPATEAETAPEPTPEPVTKDAAVLEAIKALGAKVDARFEKVEKTVEEIRGVATGAKTEVEKALRKRSDAKGGGPTETTKVATKAAPDGDAGEVDFSDVLGIPKGHGDSE